MNRHSILRFGSTFEFTEQRLRRAGYRQEWACMNAPGCDGGRQLWPKDFDWKGNESGWELRRKIKAWCLSHDVRDYRIVRNTGYVKDLHGVVYELWVHGRDILRHTIRKWASEGRHVGMAHFKTLLSIASGLSGRDHEDWVIEEMVSAGYKKDVAKNGNEEWEPPLPASKMR